MAKTPFRLSRKQHDEVMRSMLEKRIADYRQRFGNRLISYEEMVEWQASRRASPPKTAAERFLRAVLFLLVLESRGFKEN